MAEQRNEGQCRLTLLLCGLGGAGCAAAFVAPRALVPLVDCVVEGYREARDG